MYAVICNPVFYREIEQAISSKEEEILEKAVGNDIDILDEFERIGRISIKHLIIDLTAIQDTHKLIHAIKRYRIKNDKTQIIIISPNTEAPNQLIDSIVKLGIYDIIAPKAEKLEDIRILPQLLELLEEPSTYKKAVRWTLYNDNGTENGNVECEEKDGKIIEKKVVKEVIKPIYIQKTIKQQIITFYTTDNNLVKDSVLTQIAVLLAKKSEQKILVIDMNTPTPTLDHFFGISKEIMMRDIYNTSSIDTGLSASYSSIEKNLFGPDLLKSFIMPFSKNLHVLTGLYDFDLIEKMDIEHYEKIIDIAAELYDTILISVNPFWANTATYSAIKKSNKVIVTCESNWTNARNTIAIIKKEYIENQNMNIDKFNIIVTNNSSCSLNKDVMAKIFEEFNIIGVLPFNEHYEECLNKKKPFILSPYARKDIIYYLDIISRLGYIPKVSLKDRVFNRKKLFESISEEV